LVKKVTRHNLLSDISSEMSEQKMKVSARAYKATKPSLTYLEKFFEASSNQYSHDNPEGWVLLTVAENKLTYEDIIKPKLKEAHKQFGERALEDFEPFYNDMKGREKLRRSIAAYLNKHFISSQYRSSFEVGFENIVCSTGCGCLVNTLAWCLGEPGNSCIIPAPYYPAFDNDLTVMSNIIPVSAFLQENNGKFELTSESLEDAFQVSVSQGNRPAMLLLTNPNNPTGTCYSRPELELALAFTREKGMFLVSDEIYANSGHTYTHENDQSFISMFDIGLSMSADGKRIGDDIFILYGFSKDFCLSGLRAGMLYSENEEFQLAQNNLSYFGAISSDTQYILDNLISDDKWVSTLLEANNKRLSENCVLVMTLLDELDIPYFRSTSALFLVVDLRKFLTERSWEGERQLFNRLCDECNVMLTPGQDCHFKEPGFFRCCYGNCNTEGLRVGFQRIKDVFVDK